MGADGDDALTQTRLDVAEMKGMLTQALSDHGARLGQAESQIITLHGRISDKGKLLARLDERVEDLEQDSDARLGKVLGIIGAGVGLLGLALAVLNRITL